MGLWALKKSPWVYHVGASPCNNCDIEVLDCLTPRYDVERFGIILTGSPKHADALLVSGAINAKAKERVQEVYLQAAKPCVVFLIGSCAISRGIFHDSYNMYNSLSPMDVIKEVDPNAIFAFIPGCPPKPEAIIAGVVKALKAL